MGRSGALVMMAVAVAVAMVLARAQAEVADCAAKLTGCAEFLKSSDKPPASCCEPIKKAVETQLDCLCNLYTSPDFLPSIGVNISDALRLTKSCGVSVDVSKCKKVSAPAPQKGSPAPPTATGPGNGAERVKLRVFTSVVMFLGSLILY